MLGGVRRESDSACDEYSEWSREDAETLRKCERELYER